MALLLLLGPLLSAQTSSGAARPAATMKEIMLDLIHPASNDVLLITFRGGPKDDKEWAVVRRGAVTLAESANLLMMPGRVRDQADWMKDAKALADAGSAVYKAALAKDANALAGLTDALDASCTACHKQYRANVFPQGVFPREGGSK